jgi:uncharacterized BrkB/YihY/UPF0761 family membrane protein
VRRSAKKTPFLGGRGKTNFGKKNKKNSASSITGSRTAVRTMGAYERLVAQDEVVSHNSNAFNKVVDAQDRARRRGLLRRKLERLVWILASVVLVSFGDGSTDLMTIVFRRYKEAKFWFLTATLSLAANFCVLGYLVVFLQFHRRGSNWADKATWAMPTSVCMGAASFVG